MTDTVRATISCDDKGAMFEGLKAVSRTFQGAILEFNDRYQEEMPGGHRDLQLATGVEDHGCELQLNTHKMVEARETSGHRAFDVIRERARQNCRW